ncbi:FHA domain-containing protein, partial [Myxococcus sp. K15C18031901]|uniref:FHA domain-containing protein n=1 Tax=Myxococcus dinghuensis TaxID=2906761 RepID=UPI0020A6EE4A
MPFQLTISEGKDAGKEFVFDQDSVLIGRTSECDVVLYDPGVSRRHCRLFLDGESYSVEDQGSANGTLLNGSAVQTQALEDGDKLTLGPVTFVFTLMTSDLATGESDVPQDEGAGSTRIVSVDALKRQRNKGVALAPDGADESALEQMRQGATRNNLRALRPAGGTSGSRQAVPAAQEPAAIERASSAPPARRPAAGSSAPARAA